MFGIGGGLIFVPFLYYFLPILGVPESNLIYSSIGTSLLSGAVASMNAGYLHLKAKNADFKTALLIASGSVITAFLTPIIVIKTQSRILEIILGIVLLMVSIRMLFEKNENKKSFISQPLRKEFLVVVGLLVGVLSAFTGLGGGVVFVPALIYLFLFEIKRAIGTSSIVTALTMISSSISFLILGGINSLSFTSPSYVYLGAAIPLGIGAILGTMFGVKLTLKSSPLVIKKVFSVILIVAVLRILIKLY
jgi:uncharacterized membrane protein YfcA